MFGHESYSINFAQARVGVAGQKLSAKYNHAPPHFSPAPGSQRFAAKQDRNVCFSMRTRNRKRIVLFCCFVKITIPSSLPGEHLQN